MSKAAFITIHGMGRTDRTYASPVLRAIQGLLQSDAEKVTFQSVYYDGPLQQREDNVMGDMMVARKMRWSLAREIAIYGLADAVALEARRSGSSSDYFVAQMTIAETLFAAVRSLESSNRPVVFLAHSLGCQVLSNYIWDASLAEGSPKAGVWADPQGLQATLGATNDEMRFLRLGNLSAIISTGCNIPVFVAAVARQDIVPISKPNSTFEWHNFFDLDDVLGYPLQPLSDEYASIVQDHEVSVGGPLTGWNPASHGYYWSDDDVLSPLLEHLRRAINLPDFP